MKEWEMIEKIKGALSSGYARAGVLALTFAPGLVLAEGTDAFADAVTDVTTKIGTYGASLVGVAAVGVAFMVAIKYVKKIRGAA